MFAIPDLSEILGSLGISEFRFPHYSDTTDSRNRNAENNDRNTDSDRHATGNVTRMNDSDIDKNLISIGIDPGWRLMIGGVRCTNGNPYEKSSLEWIKYKSKSFYAECGHFDRTKKRMKFTKNIEDKMQKDRNNLEIELADLKYSNWFRWWTQMYIIHPLKWFSKKIRLYHQTKVTRLKFDAYIKRKKNAK